MSLKTERLMGILTTLLQHSNVTAPMLAEKFEVSRRTINRDIESLCMAGIPVVTRQGTNGGISIAEGYKLDKNFLTTDELAGIIAAVKGVGSLIDKQLYKGTLDKLNAGGSAVTSLRESIIINMEGYDSLRIAPIIKTVKQAIRECRLVEFDYYYEKGEGHRVIEPYFVIFQWSAWYIFGYCTDKKDWRMFKIARILNLSVCEQCYVPQDIPPERLDFSELHSNDTTELVAVFEGSEKCKLIDEYGAGCFNEQEDGKLLFTFGFVNMDFAKRWILSFGDKVKVLQPQYIASEIAQTAAKMAAKYSSIEKSPQR